MVIKRVDKYLIFIYQLHKKLVTKKEQRNI